MELVKLFEKRREELAAETGLESDLLVFDIDSTLMDTGPRNAAILEAAFDRYPALSPWRQSIPPVVNNWNILDPLIDAGVRDPALLEEVRLFWRERFFSDEWVLRDRPYPGVSRCLAELAGRGFRLVYLTGRHSPGMEEGTRASFFSHGLPAGDETSFFFKPSFDMDDGVFKADACAAIARMGTVAGTLDNEPGNVNLFARVFPSALNLWLRTITSPNPEPLGPGIRSVDLSVFRF